MSGRETDGRAESIRRRLRNELSSRGEDVTLGLSRYAVERFLYRLGRSSHRERFVLKGATLFAIWGTTYRPTRDVDFTGYGSSEPEDVIGAFREICNTPDDVDQLVFDVATITAKPIRDGSEYDGLRIRIRARLGESDIPIQVDVGFGNAIVPGPEEKEYRTILGDPPPGSWPTRPSPSWPRRRTRWLSLASATAASRTSTTSTRWPVPSTLSGPPSCRR
jgi:hypothetical protein